MTSLVITLAVLYSLGMLVTAIAVSVWLQGEFHRVDDTLRRLGVGCWAILAGLSWPIVVPVYLLGWIGERL